MEITKREVLASISIALLWICIGILISRKISTWQQDKNVEYDKSTRITESDMFLHAMDTNAGNAFVYGELRAVDPVTYPEIGGSYSYAEKIKQVYTMHTRTVTKQRTKPDGKVETYTDTETYWTWDTAGSESKKSMEFIFLGIQFESDRFDIPEKEYIQTIQESYYVRYQYYGVPDKMQGTIYTILKDGTIKENSAFYYGNTIEETVEVLESDRYRILFWAFWIITMIFIVYGFWRMENKWINS